MLPLRCSLIKLMAQCQNKGNKRGLTASFVDARWKWRKKLYYYMLNKQTHWSWLLSKVMCAPVPVGPFIWHRADQPRRYYTPRCIF